VVRASKRGRTRTVPLHAEAHDALRRWYAARPATVSDALFVSLRRRRSATPEPVLAGIVDEIVAKHAAAAPGCARNATRRMRSGTRSARCSPSAALRWRSSARWPAMSMSTTPVYVDVTDQRKAEGIAAL
jgi:integrase